MIDRIVAHTFKIFVRDLDDESNLVSRSGSRTKLTSRFAALLVVAASILCSLEATAATNEPLPAGAKFPSFNLPTQSGGHWALEEFSGRPKVVMFWATWCPYWRRLFPVLIELHSQYSHSNIEFVAINFDDNGDVARYRDAMGLSFPIALHGDALAQKAGVRSTPAIYFLDKDDRVRYFHSDSDPKNKAALENMIRSLLSH